METNDRPHESPEERLKDAILQVQSAAISKQIFHLSHVFTGDPSGYYAVNSTFVVCEDELAPDCTRDLTLQWRNFSKSTILSAGTARMRLKKLTKGVNQGKRLHLFMASINKKTAMTTCA
jgi:hypothetical protein